MVLLSGGLDSATTLAFALKQGYECLALSFDYGQRHKIELRRAKKIARLLGVKHAIVKLDLRSVGGSALTDDIKVPKGRRGLGAETSPKVHPHVPITYVPARNTIFLSVALAYAERLHGVAIFIGANALDYSGYPDCRPEFIRSFERTANLGTSYWSEKGLKLKIEAPLIKMTKGEIVRLALKLGLDPDLTFSCYDPTATGEACGVCESCVLREKGYREAELIP